MSVVALRKLDRRLREGYRQAGAWQDRTIAQLVEAVAEETPERLALCDQSRRLSYAEVVAESGNFARFLLEAGVRPGEAVAIQSGNRVELGLVHLACDRIGATFVPLADAWRQRETGHILERSRARSATSTGCCSGC